MARKASGAQEKWYEETPKNFRVDGVLEADVTQEEYDAEVLAGVEPEFRVKPGRHTMLRGRFDLNPEDAQTEPVAAVADV